MGGIACRMPDNHLKAYSENPRTNLLYTCDTNEDADFTDYMDLKGLDIVSVCTPTETHCEIVCDLAPFVRAIWCEKPIASTIDEACKMLSKCVMHNTSLIINHQRNYMNPKFRFSRGMLHTGTHAFALIEHLFKPEIKVDIEYIDTDEHIFELDCTHNKERMLPNVLDFIVNTLDNGRPYYDFNALEALRKCIQL